MTPLPAPLAPFLEFVRLLRRNGFATSPDQTQAFIAATGLLGPRSMADLRRAARATLAAPPERIEEFDALFDQAFLGRTLAAPAPGEAEDLPPAFDAGPQGEPPPEAGEEEPSGADATAAERLFARRFEARDDAGALRTLRRDAPAALPRRKARRTAASASGKRADPRRTLREMARRDGEITKLAMLRRRTRQRRVLFLIDISGSMKAHTDGAMRIAQALVRAADRAEVFTLGTRLTRVTRALHRRSPEQALARAASLVADWDGGTRLGEALEAFLAVPRFAGFARGALVVVLSDGLERGGPEALAASMQRLRGLAWAVLWLNPLAADAAYSPQTGAMQAILPMIDRLGDGGSVPSAVREILDFQASRVAA